MDCNTPTNPTPPPPPWKTNNCFFLTTSAAANIDKSSEELEKDTGVCQMFFMHGSKFIVS